MSEDQPVHTRVPDAQRLAAARAALVSATQVAQQSRVAPEAQDRDSGVEVPASRPRSRNRRSTSTGVPTPASKGGDGPGLDQARQIALRQLAMGQRSRHQLAEKMRDRGCQPRDIDQVLERMATAGLVDDTAYAEVFVRSKREGSGLAARALRHELRKKGVPQEIAEQAVADVSPDQERLRAQELVTDRLARMHGLDRDVKMRRLAGLLARKGYPPALAFSVVRAAVDDLVEHQRD